MHRWAGTGILALLFVLVTAIAVALLLRPNLPPSQLSPPVSLRETPLLLPGLRTGPESSPARYALPNESLPMGYRLLLARGADPLLLDEGQRLLGSRPLQAEDHYYLTENRSHYVHVELLQMENSSLANQTARTLGREADLSGKPCLGGEKEVYYLCGDIYRLIRPNVSKSVFYRSQTPFFEGYYFVYPRGPWVVQGITHDNRTPMQDALKIASTTAKGLPA